MLVLMGKSCSGKTVIAQELVSRYNYKKIVTYTTRPIGSGETNGIDYYYISDEEFDNKVKSGFFAEWKQYNTEQGMWKYGCGMDDILYAPERSVIILTPAGVKEIQKHENDQSFIEIVFCYIHANMDVICNRLINRKRGESANEILRRISADALDFENVMDLSDFSVANSGEFDISNVTKFVNEMYYECLYRKTETRINRRIEVNQNECNNIN